MSIHEWCSYPDHLAVLHWGRRYWGCEKLWSDSLFHACGYRSHLELCFPWNDLNYTFKIDRLFWNSRENISQASLAKKKLFEFSLLGFPEAVIPSMGTNSFLLAFTFDWSKNQGLSFRNSDYLHRIHCYKTTFTTIKEFLAQALLQVRQHFNSNVLEKEDLVQNLFDSKLKFELY